MIRNYLTKFISSQKFDFSKIGTYLLTVGEGAVDLVVTLITLIMVERFLGQQGLGIFSYLLSTFFIVGYLAEMGISRFVERNIAINTGNGKVQADIVSDAFQAVLYVSFACMAIFLVLSGYYASHTQIEERIVAYLIIGLTIPFRNFNGLKLALMLGTGRHDRVAKLKTQKRLIVLASIYFLLIMKIPASWLVSGFLISELYMMIQLWNQADLPKTRSAFADLNRLGNTLKSALRYLFTDDALDVLLYMDFLVLGLFVSSWDLGIYAEASIIARFFLLIPVSVKPIFRQQYCASAARGDGVRNAAVFHKTTMIMFFLHAVLGLYFLLYFSDVVNFFFQTIGKEELMSFQIFRVIFPGLLFFSAVTAQESIYEAEGRVPALQNLVIIITLMNVVLNFYLVPFAGFFGAATATTVSMFIYFLLFGRGLNTVYRVNKLLYLCVGCAVYLTYIFEKWMGGGFIVTFWMAPVMLFALFYFMDFFKFEDRLKI
ncbi:MAG: polysaccharide biosynthesis C-terminal domain-containing protein [Deltaproteobacteria bacterium]|nr:polysaccharide biosynthesis C-terminal domain-containing protein [Deltaproteobacteria bacterium]